MGYLKEVLLSCPTFTTLNVQDCHCNFQEEKELFEFAETLPNDVALTLPVDALVLHYDEYDYLRSWGIFIKLQKMKTKTLWFPCTVSTISYKIIPLNIL